MSINNFFYIKQAQAKTFDIVYFSGGNAVEFIKDFSKIFLFNAIAIVLD